MKFTAQCHFFKLKPHLHTKQQYIFYRTASIFRGIHPTLRVSVVAGGGAGYEFGGERAKNINKISLQRAWPREMTVVCYID